MKTLYTNTNTWRTTALAVCSAFLLLCCTTALNAQTTFGPFASTGAVDLTPMDNLYDGTLGSMGSSPIAVSGVTGDNVIDITVDIAITHTWEGDLTLKLESPDGTILTLASRPGLAETLDDGGGCCGNNSTLDGTAITFSDAGVTDGEELGLFGELNAGEVICSGDALCSYFPSPGATAESATSFADFFGETMDGDWTLYVGDAGSGDTGILHSWSITIVTASPSFTLSKTVGPAGGTGCFDDPIATTSVIGVSVGDSVCYFYTGTNTGDVDLDILDFIDDILAPAPGFLGIVFSLPVGASSTILWSDVPTEILAEVTNIATNTYHDAETGLPAGPETSTATVGIAPINDECADAIALDCGDVESGTTEFSNVDTEVDGIFCGSTSVTAPGVWYTVVGTGLDITASLCTGTTYDSKLFVYEGGCGTLVCVDGNDDDCGLQSSVTFTSTFGTTYHILVSGFDGNTGPFELTIDCDRPVNDLCADAISVECGDVILDSNVGATESGVSCNASSTGGGVWYSIVGTGDDITATTCSPNTTFDTEIVIFDACGDPCLTNNDDDSACPTDDVQSTVTWTSTFGQTYFINVAGWITGGDNFGDFELSITCARPVNDECADAIALDCGESVVGTTFGASDIGNSAALDCGEISGDVGVWYTVEGTGGVIELSTCGPVTDASGTNAFMAVYDGTCGTFNCIVNNNVSNPDLGCGTANSELVSFASTYGTTYYIFVSSWTGGVLDFDLTVTCGPPTNDLCSGAISVDCGDVVVGTTTYATEDYTDPACSNGFTIGNGVWYSFAGTGDEVTVSACNSLDDDLELNVWTGACGNLVCLGGNDDFCGLLPEFTFLSTQGVTYFINIAGWTTGDPGGDYELEITCTCPASAIMSGGGLSCGGATVDVEIAFTGTGPWDVSYEDPVAGTVSLDDVAANPLVIATSDAGGFSLNSVVDQGGLGCSGTVSGSATVTVGVAPVAGFTSTQASGTLDVDFTDVSAGDPTSWAWDFGDLTGTSTDQDPSYTYGASGSYDVELVVTNACGSDNVTITVVVVPVVVAPANDLCDNAETIACDGTATGSTEFASDADATDCNAGRLGVWYHFVGDGSSITVSLDNAGTDYDTFLGISESCAGACVASDDDGGTGTTSEISGFLTVLGQDYYIYVSGFLTNTGNYELTITCEVPPVTPDNDLCDDAQVVACGSVTLSSNVGATISAPSNCAFGTIGEGVWFSLVGDGSEVTASTCSVNSTFDSEMAVFTGDCNSLVCVDGNDDDGNCGIDGLLSTVVFVAEQGVTYYIYVGSFSDSAGEFGDFELSITCATPPVPPANDDCAGAAELPVGLTCVPVAGDVTGATESMVGCEGTANNDVWYGFVATGPTATVEVVGSASFDAVFEVFTGANCGVLVSIACQDTNFFGGGSESLELTGLTIGETYYVRVYDWYSAAPATPTFDICVHALIIGVTDALSEGLNVYPNPSNGEFVIEMSGVEGDAALEVMDVTGRVVYSEIVTLNGNFRKTMNLDVAKGSYLLQISTEEGSVTRKIELH